MEGLEGIGFSNVPGAARKKRSNSSRRPRSDTRGNMVFGQPNQQYPSLCLIELFDFGGDLGFLEVSAPEDCSSRIVL
ncbi:hypothetical protein LWI29_018742 [Acer saccharum]|uniref:Uncharacterized protein n=1 Tax=Acer saccharum TaxID=4024 RepID=A0AA39T4A2_ACESA|nr:hypothetical protein LWI29_018742 [Acer saccharum]